MKISDETLADLRAKHGRVRVYEKELEDDDGNPVLYSAAFKCPSPVQYDRFFVERDDEETKHQAFKTLVRSCAVYPDAACLKEMFDAAPGLAHAFGNALLKWAGLGAAQHAKKSLSPSGKQD